ncbi:lipid-A-disaccharide synthase [Massilia sp. W12]|uniref:lipid-A-disaccharide synthase n=1 Tax=Massilia sp. W12 TaxID=3126507 RepID=UPI0030D167B8
MASCADSQALQIAMVAGEASGDLLAARLLSGLRVAAPQAVTHGIGGPKMQELGFRSDFPMEKLSVRGLFEVLAHYREIKGIQNALRAQLLQEKPAVFIGVDAPDFNLGLEAALRAAGIPTMHYIGPSIWAWRGGRIKKIKRAVSHMLVVFPFEPEIYQAAGIPATYVGHPLAQVIALAPDLAAARTRLGLHAAAPVLTVLPGSRMSELKYNSAAFVAAAHLLAKRAPGLQIVLPLVSAAHADYLRALLAQAGVSADGLQIVIGGSYDAMAAADVVLVASGTATLEVALHKKPMVIAYKMMAASWHILKHMGYQPWIGLPNILAREFLVPELLQHAATPQALADALSAQLARDAAPLQKRFLDMHHSLLRDSAQEASRAVLQVIKAGA